MIERVLVPLDGSSFALQAVGPALEIVAKGGGSLHLVSVSDPDLAGPGLADVELSYEKALQGYLDEVRSEILESRDLSVESRVLVGSPADALMDEVRDGQIGLVVMSTHGRGPLSRIWMGSVADRVVRQSPCPVLTVRPQEEPEPLGLERPFQVEHILVPLDGSEVGDVVLEHAAELARLFGAGITLLSAIWVPRQISTEALPHTEWADWDSLLEDRAESARVRLEGIRERLEARDLRAEVVVEKEAHPAEAIVERSRADDVDLIAMGTHGRGGVGRMVLGSVADKVFRASFTPVLLVRGPE
ncbi:MAG: universal stress protein [Gemmatimonadota bacterium]